MARETPEEFRVRWARLWAERGLQPDGFTPLVQGGGGGSGALQVPDVFSGAGAVESLGAPVPGRSSGSSGVPEALAAAPRPPIENPGFLQSFANEQAGAARAIGRGVSAAAPAIADPFSSVQRRVAREEVQLPPELSALSVEEVGFTEGGPTGRGASGSFAPLADVLTPEESGFSQDVAGFTEGVPAVLSRQDPETLDEFFELMDERSAGREDNALIKNLAKLQLDAEAAFQSIEDNTEARQLSRGQKLSRVLAAAAQGASGAIQDRGGRFTGVAEILAGAGGAALGAQIDTEDLLAADAERVQERLASLSLKRIEFGKDIIDVQTQMDRAAVSRDLVDANLVATGMKQLGPDARLRTSILEMQEQGAELALAQSNYAMQLSLNPEASMLTMTSPRNEVVGRLSGFARTNAVHALDVLYHDVDVGLYKETFDIVMEQPSRLVQGNKVKDDFTALKSFSSAQAAKDAQDQLELLMYNELINWGKIRPLLVPQRVIQFDRNLNAITGQTLGLPLARAK